MSHEEPLTYKTAAALEKMGPLVGTCKYCKEKCCNCRVCVGAKANNFNVCAPCYRRVSAVHAKV